MIIEGFCNVIFLFVNFIINTLPKTPVELFGTGDSVTLLARALTIFPVDCWLFIVGNIITWSTISLGWSVIEWCYNKIPGIN